MTDERTRLHTLRSRSRALFLSIRLSNGILFAIDDCEAPPQEFTGRNILLGADAGCRPPE